jgi:hypothetical protein
MSGTGTLSAFFGGSGGGGGSGFRVRGTKTKPPPTTKQKKTKDSSSSSSSSKPSGSDKAIENVRASEASTTVLHAEFCPLPEETNVPRAYENEEFCELFEDDAASEQWDFVNEDADMEEPAPGADDEPEDDMDDASSMDDNASDLSGSFEDTAGQHMLRRRRQARDYRPRPVYAGPQLCADDDADID